MDFRLILKTVKMLFLLVFLSAVGTVMFFYFSTPVYQFIDPKPFQGKFLHNPYQHIDSALWRKYNFQVQSYAWGGLTDGRVNSDHLIDSIYRLFGYDYVATSDYQRINTYHSGSNQFIPTYEHGYNIPKIHQVCIGAKKVLWRDYFLFQTLNTKQHIINELKRDCEIVALAHPRLKDGYSLSDMKYLSGYDLLEVLNNFRVSDEHWDAALSNGHRAYILANDDAHNVLNSNEVGRRFTLIHSNSLHRDSIIKSLRNGAAYGVDFYRVDDEPMTRKMERSGFIPFLKQARLFGDTLKIKVSESVFHVYFIGDHGKVKYEVDHVSEAQYVIDENDSYIRVEIHCNDASVLYLNPVTRQETDGREKQDMLKINWSQTWFLRSSGIILLLFAILFLRYFIKRKSTT
jgi:hypothetical protein